MNFKGCEIYKELKIKRFPPLRKEKLLQSTNLQQTKPIAQQENPISYSDILKNTDNPQSHSDMTELKDMFKQLVSQMSIMLNLLTILV